MNQRLPDLTQVNGFAYGDDELILNPKAPLDSARRLLADRYTINAAQLLHHHRGSFYGWTGTHYLDITPAYIDADIYHFLEYARKYEQRKHEAILTDFHPTRAAVAEIHAALRAASYLGDAIESPAWLTEVCDLDPKEILSCENGLLHLPSQSLMPHTPYYYTHNAIDYPYESNASIPNEWLNFLNSLWPDDQPAIDTLQEIFGYCLMPDTSQQKAFMLIGPKRSGKGTIARILEAVIGPYNCISPTLASLGTTFGLQPFLGKRLATISDARISGKTDTSVVAERVLAITGEDSVTVDRKFLGPWTGKLATRFLVVSNELPRIADASGALPSRFIVLMMTNSFYGREDRALTQRLLGERSAILNWAIAGYRRLAERGYFDQPASAADAVRELEDLSSPVGAFVRDACLIAPGRSIHVDLLYDAWCAWCREQGRDHTGTKQSFGRDLRTVLPHIKISHPRGDDGKPQRYYEGISARI